MVTLPYLVAIFDVQFHPFAGDDFQILPLPFDRAAFFLLLSLFEHWFQDPIDAHSTWIFRLSEFLRSTLHLVHDLRYRGLLLTTIPLVVSFFDKSLPLFADFPFSSI